MIQIEAVEEFRDACDEIHLLIKYSKKNSKDFKKYATFNKAAIVLLCAKFEAFLESFLEEYAFFHLNLSSNLTVDRFLYDHMIECIVSHLEIYKTKPEKRKESIVKLATLCGTAEIRPINDFRVDSKLRFGKHGQGEVERLLKAFGFIDYAVSEKVKSFFITFNSLNSMRNNIIHEDATPSLTHQNVKSYLDSVEEFISGLETIAVNKISLAV
ncbi:MAG: HEPN domain-containing protein [Bacteroidota bacterium]